MTVSRKAQWIIFVTINVLLIAAVLMFPFYLTLAKMVPTIGDCVFPDYGLYCPACGGTRSLSALTRFDIIGSLRYNVIVPLCAAAFVVYEVLMVKHLIKGGEREMMLKPKYIYIFLAVWGIYFIVRNILLFCGIDLIGDILI